MMFDKENSINTLSNESKLIIRTMGSTEAVNKALTIYEYEDSIIIVDCGLGYPDIFEMPGVDVLIPDFTYLVENSHKIKGLFLTHGHEDHIGAVPHLLLELPNVPIYASKLVIEMLKSKFKDKTFKSLNEGVSLNLFDPSSNFVNVGKFRIRSIHVNHSIPEAQAFVIESPQGIVIHAAEYKFDDTPVLDKPIDIKTFEEYGKKGVLCLISDCLLASVPGSTKSEKTLSQTFFDLFEKAQGRQVLVTTISSNISRMYQMMSAAIKYGRKIVPSGRSIEEVVAISQRLGYLPFDSSNFISDKQASDYAQKDLAYLIAGCYGQENSSLGRVARDDNEDIHLEKDALVVFSGDPSPPGADITVEKMTDTLILKGAEVISSELQENLHVSGHGTREDVIRMSKIVNPRYFIPVGGTITKMRLYKNLIQSIGFRKGSVFECLEGDCVEFFDGKANRGKHINLEPVYISSGSVEKLNPRVIQDRETLSEDGVFVVVIALDKKGNILSGKVEIVTRGFIYVKSSQGLMNEARKFVTKAINKHRGKQKDWNDLKRKVENDLQRFLYKKTARSPLIIIHSITI